MTTDTCEIDGNKVFLHTYFNAKFCAEQNDSFMRYLHQLRIEILSGKMVDKNKEDYENYFIIKKYNQW
jgi:hypothetical protein